MEADQALGKALHGACSCLEQNKNILLRQPFQRNIWGDRIVMHKRFKENRWEIYMEHDLVRLPELQRLLGGVSKAVVYRWMKTDGLPAPLRIGGRCVAWHKNEVLGWISERERGGSENLDAA